MHKEVDCRYVVRVMDAEGNQYETHVASNAPGKAQSVRSRGFIDRLKKLYCEDGLTVLSVTLISEVAHEIYIKDGVPNVLEMAKYITGA